MNDKEFLGTDPINRLLLKLAVPAVVAQLINILYSVVDRIYIGHIPGEGRLALTGIGICMPIILIVTAFSSFSSHGGAPRASVFLGKGDTESAEKTMGGCFALQLVISFIITGILLIWNEDLLMAFGASENTIDPSTEYLSIYALGTVFVQITLGMNTFIITQGFTKVSMFSVLIGAVCNIILDPVFIFLLDMGVKGAALATIISQAISAIWILGFLCGKNTHIKLKKIHFRLTPSVILPCILLGTSGFIMKSSESIVGICFNASLVKYGGDIAVGAMTILMSVMQLTMLPLQGLAHGTQPICSYNYGAEKPDRVKKAFHLALKVSVIYTASIWLLVLFFPDLFAKLFTLDSELIDYTTKALRIYFAVLVVLGIQVVCQMTFTALGHAKSSIAVAVVRKFVLLLPLIYILPHITQDPTTGVFLAEPIADVLAVSFTSVLFFIQFRRSMRELEKVGHKQINADDRL